MGGAGVMEVEQIFPNVGKMLLMGKCNNPNLQKKKTLKKQNKKKTSIRRRANK